VTACNGQALDNELAESAVCTHFERDPYRLRVPQSLWAIAAQTVKHPLVPVGVLPEKAKPPPSPAPDKCLISIYLTSKFENTALSGVVV
jgi:hypothetical protein